MNNWTLWRARWLITRVRRLRRKAYLLQYRARLLAEAPPQREGLPGETVTTLYDENRFPSSNVFPYKSKLNLPPYQWHTLNRIILFLKVLGHPEDTLREMSWLDMCNQIDEEDGRLLSDEEKYRITANLGWSGFPLEKLKKYSYKKEYSSSTRLLIEDVARANALSSGIASLIATEDPDFCGSLLSSIGLRSLLELTGKVASWSANSADKTFREKDPIDYLKKHHSEKLGRAMGYLSNMVHNQDGDPVLIAYQVDSPTDNPVTFRYKTEWYVGELVSTMHLLQTCNEILDVAFQILMENFSDKLKLENVDWDIHDEDNPLVVTADKVPEVDIEAAGISPAENILLWKKGNLKMLPAAAAEAGYSPEKYSVLAESLQSTLHARAEATVIWALEADATIPHHPPTAAAALREMGLKAKRQADGSWKFKHRWRGPQK